MNLPKKFLAPFLFGFLALTTPSFAADVIAEYHALLGPEDMVNSQGKRLTSLGAIIAQDRANYHRFGLRHELDTVDPIFTNQRMRQRIPEYLGAGRSVERYIVEDVLTGRGHYVYIRIMGTGGGVTHIDVYEGAG